MIFVEESIGHCFIAQDEFVADDIAVRFYEQDDEGNVKWEDFGNFANHDVHRQVMLLLCVLIKLNNVYSCNTAFEILWYMGILWIILLQHFMLYIICCFVVVCNSVSYTCLLQCKH